METDIMSLIGNYAFPVVVCLWFMFRTEKVISRNTEAIDKIGVIVSQCPAAKHNI